MNYYDFVHDIGLNEELKNVQAQPKDADRERFLGQVNKMDMQLTDPHEAVLFQLVTPDGDEFDYSLLGVSQSIN